MKVGVVVPSIHRWNFDIASMWFIHGLVIEFVLKNKTAPLFQESYLETKHTGKVANMFGKHLPHVEIGILQESLDTDGFFNTGFGLSLDL